MDKTILKPLVLWLRDIAVISMCDYSSDQSTYLVEALEPEIPKSN